MSNTPPKSPSPNAEPTTGSTSKEIVVFPVATPIDVIFPEEEWPETQNPELNPSSPAAKSSSTSSDDSQSSDEDYKDIGGAESNPSVESEDLREGSDDSDDIVLSEFQRLAQKRKGKRVAGSTSRPSKRARASASAPDVDPVIDLTISDADDSDWEIPENPQNFYSQKHKEQWNAVSSRLLRIERIIDRRSFDELGVTKFLESRRLLQSVEILGEFSDRAVREVYANLSPRINEANSRKFGKAYFRNRIYDFSPSMINSILGTPDDGEHFEDFGRDEVIEFLTGGRMRRWVGNFSVTNLTSLYTVLFKIAIYNWNPTANDSRVAESMAQLLFAIGKNLHINWGKYILDQIAYQGERPGRGILPFPSIIWQLLIHGGYKPKKEDCVVKAKFPYTIPQNHLTGLNKVVDLPWRGDQAHDVEPAAGSTSSSTSALENHIKFLEGTIASLMAQRNELKALLSSQKGGDDCAKEEATEVPTDGAEHEKFDDGSAAAKTVQDQGAVQEGVQGGEKVAVSEGQGQGTIQGEHSGEGADHMEVDQGADSGAVASGSGSGAGGSGVKSMSMD